MFECLYGRVHVEIFGHLWLISHPTLDILRSSAIHMKHRPLLIVILTFGLRSISVMLQKILNWKQTLHFPALPRV